MILNTTRALNQFEDTLHTKVKPQSALKANYGKVDLEEYLRFKK